jgi:hypothetical protein
MAKNYKPMETLLLSGGDAEEVEDATEPAQMAAFFIKCIKNDALGRLANMHLALCDQLPLGAMEGLAKRLAQSQAVAVDFPKTGLQCGGS